MKKMLTSLLCLPLGALVFGCGGGNGGEDELSCAELPYGKIRQDCIDKQAPKADRWDARNDPQLFGVDLEYRFAELPLAGRAEQMPWPDTYWPTYADSVNDRWQGQDSYSPLEKYDLAFNDWTPPEGFDNLIPFSDCGSEFDAEYYEQLGPAARYWSNNKGNKRQRDMWDDEGCEDEIESWWGLCHAWVPAAILEPEPARAVTYNGVTFEVSDIKALLMMMYDRSKTRFLGRRCNLKNEEIERDEYGRIEQTECRDTNAGSLYLIVTNMLGRDKRAFAEDRTMSYQVWNQPVVGYEIKNHIELDEAEAAKLIDTDCDADGNSCEYIWNEDAERFYEVLMDVDYITESHASADPMVPQIDRYIRTDEYHMIVEADADGAVIGGEWISESVNAFPDRVYTGDSQATHADFLWLPLRAGWRANPHADLDKIRMLVRMSLEDEQQGDIDAKTYAGEADVAIPDDDPAGASAFVDVPDDIQIDKLRVAVRIEHSYIGDLTLTLKHGGHAVELQKNAGGSTDDIEKTFDVTGFAGSAAGEWELHVADNAARDTGTIRAFELIVVSGDDVAPTDDEIFSAEPGADIPDDDEAGMDSTIAVPGSGAIKTLRVTVDISHTWISDLTVELHHGTGVAVLHNREGNDSDDIQKTYTVEDFNNVDSSGDWKLVISDKAQYDTGVLNAWSLEMERR
jgi:subtilisin-like proprotein convertase family protein